VRDARISSPENGLLAANLRKGRRFRALGVRSPPRSPAQLRFPGAVRITFNLPRLWRRRRGTDSVAKNAAPVPAFGKRFPGRNSLC
jgi:hypothetical protein